MGLFRESFKCPACGNLLEEKPKRKQICSHCGNAILVRDGKLVTEEGAFIIDWLMRLEYFGVSRKDFNQARNQLTKQFGKNASANDTIWRILNNLVIKFGTDNTFLEQVYREMSSIVSAEGIDPTPYLLEAEKAREKQMNKPSKHQNKLFLGHDELSYARQLRIDGKLDQAEEFLMNGEPSPAVLDEIRKIASVRARQKKNECDWVAVIYHLEKYSSYADKNRKYCIEMVNQEPPSHTKSDIALLKKAKANLNEGTI